MEDTSTPTPISIPGTPLKTRSLPPKNMNPGVYAHNWRTQTAQTSPNANCSYCDGGHHGSSSCFYLCPDTRPVTWKPYTWLWHLDGASSSCFGYGDGVQSETASERVCLPDVGVTPVSVPAQPAKVIRIASTMPMSEISITIDRRAEIS